MINEMDEDGSGTVDFEVKTWSLVLNMCVSRYAHAWIMRNDDALARLNIFLCLAPHKNLYIIPTPSKYFNKFITEHLPQILIS